MMILVVTFYPYNSNPRPANAAALLKQDETATSLSSGCL
jgi:hypothetical protein